MFLITDPDLTFLFTVFWGLVILGIFRFFLPVHPFWRHEKAAVQVEDILTYTSVHTRYGRRTTYYTLAVHVDGQKRYVRGDREDHMGDTIDVLYSASSIIKCPKTLIDPKAVSAALILAVLLLRTFVFILQTYLVPYLVVLAVIWVLWPFLYCRHCKFEVDNCLYGMEHGKDRIFNKDTVTGDLFRGSKKADTILGIILAVVFFGGIILFFISLRVVG